LIIENVSTLETEKNKLYENLTSLESEKSILIQNVSTLESEKSVLIENVSTLESEKCKLFENLSSLESEKSVLIENVSTLQKYIYNYKKIIIFGFPHSGTTILRCILGHINNLYEIEDEIFKIDDNNSDYINYNFVLCKWPYVINENDLKKNYADYIKIFIMRNPLYVFSSLNKRFKNNILDHNHDVNKYIDTMKEFNKFKNNENNINNLFLIRYEDMFENNYKNLKYIFDKIGFNYNDDIFDNSKYINKV